MAISYLHFDDQKQHGRMLRRGLQMLEESRDLLVDTLATMTRMVDGDGSDAAHFAEVVTRFGFTSNANAKAAWDELNSVLAKITTDGSVSNTHAALEQAFAKFRA